MLLLVVLCADVSSSLAFNDTVSLTELDQRLTDLLLHPEDGKGSILLSDGYFLYTNLDDLSDMIEAKDPEGSQIYNEIERAGGIQFYKVSYNPETVRTIFKYDADNYELLLATIGGVENTWKSIQEMLNATASEGKLSAANPLTQW